jgi:hypothetical protein
LDKRTHDPVAGLVSNAGRHTVDRTVALEAINQRQEKAMNELPNDTPTRGEVDALRRQVEALDALVNGLVHAYVKSVDKAATEAQERADGAYRYASTGWHYADEVDAAVIALTKRVDALEEGEA